MTLLDNLAVFSTPPSLAKFSSFTRETGHSSRKVMSFYTNRDTATMNIHIIGLDPGTTQSALVVFDGERVIRKWIEPNETMLEIIRGPFGSSPTHGTILAYEMFASYGMAVGAECFETVLWTGRFIEAWGETVERVYRRDVKLNLCNSPRAKDANVSQALRDRFGGKSAIGTKKQPGPLYGVKSHLWAALGVAVTAWDKIQAGLDEGVA